MTILFMVSMALVLSATFVVGYLWAASNGQFDDLETPAHRILKKDFSNEVTKRNKYEKHQSL